jgi:predicted ATPase
VNSVLYPVLDVIKRNLLRLGTSDPIDLPVCLERWLEALGMEPAQHVPLLGQLLSTDASSRYRLLNLPGVEYRRRTFEVLAGVVLALGAQRPVLLVAEDLHWLDPTTLEFLDQVVTLARSERIFMLATSRPEFMVPWRGEPY